MPKTKPKPAEANEKQTREQARPIKTKPRPAAKPSRDHPKTNLRSTKTTRNQAETIRKTRPRPAEKPARNQAETSQKPTRDQPRPTKNKPEVQRYQSKPSRDQPETNPRPARTQAETSQEPGRDQPGTVQTPTRNQKPSR